MQDNTIQLRRTGILGQHFSVRLLGLEGHNQDLAGMPLKSTRLVVLEVFGDGFPIGTLVLHATLQTRIVLRRVCSYLLAKKNSLYLQFKSQYGVLPGLRDTDRMLEKYEKADYVLKAAKAAVVEPMYYFLDAEIARGYSEGGFCMGHYTPGYYPPACSQLLLARRNADGEIEFYNPIHAQVCLFAGVNERKVEWRNAREGELGQEFGQNPIIFWECEETLSLLHYWDSCLDFLDKDLDLEPTMLSNQHLKRVRDETWEVSVSKRRCVKGS
ncbi:hypothetical protein F5Y06DRAFT_25838 [Hypoxylon sp. FL0890]|nr:hypothetical protein F5Y06DRAFT_25838 [Hypoxylon sp. FL0890]